MGEHWGRLMLMILQAELIGIQEMVKDSGKGVRIQGISLG